MPVKKRSKLQPVLSCIFIAVLCAVAYAPIRDRLALSDVQSMVWGPAIYALEPLLLTLFAVMFSLATFYISVKMGAITS